MDARERRAVVVGAGISGLVCAYRLRQRGWSVRVVEATDRVGGVIQSKSIDGFICEAGPNSLRETQELTGLIGELNLDSERMEADPRLPRFVFCRGKLHKVPMGPGALLTSSLLSLRGKIRLMTEPWVEPRREAHEETLADFIRRRFGPEVLERLGAPFVSGVYAGDAARLSVRSSFPMLVELEEKHGSVLRGFIRSAREARAKGDPPKRPTLISFREGLEMLPRALAASLGSSALLLGTRAESIGDSPWGGLQLQTRSAAGTLRLDTDVIVLALPSYRASEIVRPFAASAARHLDAIPHPAVVVAHLTLDAGELPRPLAGFGFLVPRTEPVRILGCIWSSSLFPGRAPSGSVLLTVIFGGMTDPEAFTLPDATLLDIASRDLHKTLGIRATPRLVAMERIERAIPQYHPGHAARLEKIEGQLAAVPGLYLAGSYLRGISIGECVAQAEALASRIDEAGPVRRTESGTEAL